MAFANFPLAVISRQFGRASAPTTPQRLHTIRGPKVRTSTASLQPSADSTALAQLARHHERLHAQLAHVAEVLAGHKDQKICCEKRESRNP
jgi:hypothetical protein